MYNEKAAQINLPKSKQSRRRVEDNTITHINNVLLKVILITGLVIGGLYSMKATTSNRPTVSMQLGLIQP